eukprot:TRINITY_DN39450_c0_g1_i1.p1 TRINITY_DN39450_c0_g1~~TRINITY_DN39450_c0_g1_i1.p1  ORF type:complete len:566 (-),score=120.88 TRINITY_DN39450_c0_g1_i1:219-1889(-)
MDAKKGKMVKTRTADNMEQAQRQAEARQGRIAVASRYHRLPRRLEHDFEFNERDVLGSGVNGSVFAATHRHTGARFAIKNLMTQGIDQEQKKLLAGEVEIFLSMDHPHVAQLVGVYESENMVSLVMECMSGGELFDRVKSKKVFTEREASQATWQMLLAINYLHHEGITHRDLKLENFLYDEPGSDFLKLIDFGFSKFYEGKVMDQALGTITYVAPEVLKRKYSKGSCDLWSLGCITFVLLFGYLPFIAPDDQTIARLIVKGEYKVRQDRWSKVSQDAQDFVKQLLIVDPRRRMTALQAISHPFVEGTIPQTCPVMDARVAGGFLSLVRANEFKRAVLQVMAWSLPKEEQKKLREAFIHCCTNRDGILEIKDIERVLREELRVDEREIHLVMRGLHDMDADDDGELHYSDFIAAMTARELDRSQRGEHLMREAFRRFDANNSGCITLETFSNVVGHGTPVDAEIFNGGSHKMNLEEFMEYLCWDGRPASLYASDNSMTIHPETSSKRAWFKSKFQRMVGCTRRPYSAAVDSPQGRGRQEAAATGGAQLLKAALGLA